MSTSITKGRLDHERMYLWVHAGLVIIGIGFALSAAPYESGPLSPSTNGLLALALVFGSALTLAGAATGSSWFMPFIHDVRVPYAMAGFGQLSVVVGLGSFAWVLIKHSTGLPGILTAGLAISISCGCIHITWRYIVDVYKRSQIISELRASEASEESPPL